MSATTAGKGMQVTIHVSPVAVLQPFNITFDGDATIGEISIALATEIQRRYGYIGANTSDVLRYAYDDIVTIPRPEPPASLRRKIIVPKP